MVLDVYTCLWNEVRLLPFFLAHYGPVCRRIVALDDGSDDGTIEMLAAHPKVELRRMPEERDSWVLASTRWWNEVWKESRDADWVGIVVPDEIVGPDLLTALRLHKIAGRTVLTPRVRHGERDTRPSGSDARRVAWNYPGEFAAWMAAWRPGRGDRVIHLGTVRVTPGSARWPADAAEGGSAAVRAAARFVSRDAAGG